MTAITLEAVQARQAELAEMIGKLQQAQALGCSRITVVAETEIELRPGEHYAGVVLTPEGEVLHHLVLMAEKPPVSRLDWNDAMQWASGVGGHLPTRQEQALLFANCKPHLDAAWHWSGEEHEDDASSAWHCGFGDGGQSSSHKSAEGCARAVRRFVPSVL